MIQIPRWGSRRRSLFVWKKREQSGSPNRSIYFRTLDGMPSAQDRNFNCFPRRIISVIENCQPAVICQFISGSKCLFAGTGERPVDNGSAASLFFTTNFEISNTNLGSLSQCKLHQPMIYRSLFIIKSEPDSGLFLPVNTCKFALAFSGISRSFFFVFIIFHFLVTFILDPMLDDKRVLCHY